MAGADLTDLVNVGRAVAGYFARVGITRSAQLTGRDPIEVYEQMSAACGEALDPCLLDTIMSAVDQSATAKPNNPSPKPADWPPGAASPSSGPSTSCSAWQPTPVLGPPRPQ
nr:helix-hairpin-helix domain-containing protein [Actinomadura citrea]